jgi:hypothetical protein
MLAPHGNTRGTLEAPVEARRHHTYTAAAGEP